MTTLNIPNMTDSQPLDTAPDSELRAALDTLILQAYMSGQHNAEYAPSKTIASIVNRVQADKQALLDRLEAEGPKSVIGTKRGMFDTGMEIDIYKDGYNAAVAAYTQAISKLRKELQCRN